LDAGGVAHGAGDLDAAAKERRPGRSIWRGGDGKYFRRTNHKRAREIHGLAGGDFFRSDVHIVDPLCAQERGRERASARADENASGRTSFSGAGSFSTFASLFRRARFRRRRVTGGKRNTGSFCSVAPAFYRVGCTVRFTNGFGKTKALAYGAENAAVSDRGHNRLARRASRRRPRFITKEGLTKQVDRPLRRAMPLVSGFAAIINIERGALDPPRAAALAVKVCQIVTSSS